MEYVLVQAVTSAFRALALARVPAREFEYWTALSSPASPPAANRPARSSGGNDMTGAR